jgi:hypothetical protein
MSISKEKGKRRKEKVNLPGSPPWRVPIAIGKGWVKANKTLLTTELHGVTRRKNTEQKTKTKNKG